jgi:hypothetical protein
MAQQTLLGGDGTTGENGATHNSKANSNFTELYAASAAAQADADAAQTAISDHISDGTAAHAGTAIAFTPVGTITATNVQDAIAEVATEAGASVPNASDTVAGIVELLTPAEVITGTDTTKAATAEGIHGKVVGVQDLYYPAKAMLPRITSGCQAATQYEFTTSLVNLVGLAFDQTAQEFAQFEIVPPRKYNNGTITATPVWTAQSGSGTVQWGISFRSYRNDDALTVALGTAQTSDDTLIATNDLHIGPDTSAITPAGTLQDGSLMVGQISRNPASDTLSGDAILIGVWLHFTTDAAKDA